MHIPFSGNKDKQDRDVPHIVVLEDHSNAAEGDEEGFRDDPDPSPPLTRGIPTILRKHHDTAMSHAFPVAHGVVDVLYENQRGSFLCGIPLFASSGLWVTDPHAWTTLDQRYSPFTIFNATLPDPSWEWVWKRWFVDMSGDVDENGWMYNINFTKHHWHGHHIWYHSFVRRRRWLRKRRKTTKGDRAQTRSRNPAMEDYFTIYSTPYRPDGSIHAGGQDFKHNEDDSDEEDAKVENVGDLYRALRAARIDREKLDALNNFLCNGRDLEALAGEMQKILRFMVFQESRRQLLTLLAQKCQEFEKNHTEQPDLPDQYKSDPHQCVLNAIDMAETLIKSLDYNSDRAQLSRAEEDAELDRLMAVKLGEQASARDRRLLKQSKEEETEELDNFKIDSLQSTVDTSKNAKPKASGKAKLKRSVSFKDDVETDASQSSTKHYSKQEKGKGKEH